MSEVPSVELHPLTKQVLSRRKLMVNGGTAVTFLGIGFLVTGCGDDEETATTTTTGGSAGDPTTTAAAGDETTTTEAGSDTTMEMPDGDSLYARLGGYDGITAVMENFVKEQVANDDRINSFFASSDLDNLVLQLADFTAAATGGTEEYTGADMKSAHEGMGVTLEDFNALVEDLGIAMTELDVPATEQGEVVAALAPLEADIVEA